MTSRGGPWWLTRASPCHTTGRFEPFPLRWCVANQPTLLPFRGVGLAWLHPVGALLFTSVHSPSAVLWGCAPVCLPSRPATVPIFCPFCCRLSIAPVACWTRGRSHDLPLPCHAADPCSGVLARVRVGPRFCPPWAGCRVLAGQHPLPFWGGCDSRTPRACIGRPWCGWGGAPPGWAGLRWGAGAEGEGALPPSSSPFSALCAVAVVRCDPRGSRVCARLGVPAVVRDGGWPGLLAG